MVITVCAMMGASVLWCQNYLHFMKIDAQRDSRGHTHTHAHAYTHTHTHTHTHTQC